MSDNVCVSLCGPKDLRLVTCATPEPSEGEVQIRVTDVGICGTDIHIWQTGTLGGDVVNFPLVLGHEAVGVISAVGPGVIGLKVGDRVALDSIMPCCKCFACLSGQYNVCEVRGIKGVDIDGFLTKFIVLPERNCHVLPGNISQEAGVMLEPLSITVLACERGKVSLGETVLVCGSGTIGLLQLQTVKAAGARTVCVTDISKTRLSLAEKLGADFTVDVSGLEPKDAAVRVEGLLGKKADVSFECVGNDAAIATTIYSTRSGGRAVMIGIPTGLSRVPIDDAVLRQVDIIPSLGYLHSHPKAISLIEQGKVDVTSLITHHFSLDNISDAYRSVEGGAGMKSIISLK